MDNLYEIVREKYRDLVQVIIGLEILEEKKIHYQNVYKTKNVKKSIENCLKEYIHSTVGLKQDILKLSDNYWDEYEFSDYIIISTDSKLLNLLHDFQNSCFFYFNKDQINNFWNANQEHDKNSENKDVNAENFGEMDDMIQKFIKSNFREMDDESADTSFLDKQNTNFFNEMKNTNMFSFIENICENFKNFEEDSTIDKPENVKAENAANPKDENGSSENVNAKDGSDAIEFPEEIVKLAQELSSEIKIPDIFKEVGVDENMDESDIPKKIFEKMTTPAGQEVFMNLMRQTGEKIQSKIKSGEINENKIRSSAQECLKTFMNKNKDLQNIFGKNFAGCEGSEFGSTPDANFNIGDLFSNLNNSFSNSNPSKNEINSTKQRLQKKLENKKKAQEKVKNHTINN